MTTSPYDIRPGDPNSEEAMLLGHYAFGSTTSVETPEDRERRASLRITDRVLLSYVDDVAIAKVAIVPMTTNVRGKVIPMGGISGVASMPAARRSGHIRELMLHAIRDMHKQGEAVSTLYPFKTSYYEKFGYAGWQAPMWLHINPSALSPYLAAPKTGTVKQRRSAEAIDDTATVLVNAQHAVHGMSLFQRSKQDAWMGYTKNWVVTVHEGDNVTAAMSYRNDLDKSELVVSGIFWSTYNGKLNLLDFLARHVDQVKTIRMEIHPGDEPYLWTTLEGNMEILTNDEESWGPPMGRIVNVSGLTGIGVGKGSVCLTVVDHQAPWNSGTFTFTEDDGSLLVHEGGEPTGEVSIHGLSALVFSGIDAQFLPVRGWGSVSDEAAKQLTRMFPPVTPYIFEKF